jgi:hypothetical protein
MERRARVLMVFALCGALAACTSSAESGTTTSSPTPTTTGTATATTFGVGKPGQISAYILSVDLSQHTITIDPMQFLTGAAATAAFEKLNPGTTGGPPNDYAIVNAKVDPVTYALAPDVVVRLVHVGGKDHTQPVLVQPSKFIGYPALDSRPFWITIENQAIVTEIDEQFVP